MFRLFEKHRIRPQVWKTAPSPEGATQEERVEAAARALLPLARRTRAFGVKLGLYNHGGWGGEPENLVAVCKRLRRKTGSDHVGIVYNFHHGHDHIRGFAGAFEAMRPYLLCVNLNGMVEGAKPKILAIGEGSPPPPPPPSPLRPRSRVSTMCAHNTQQSTGSTTCPIVLEAAPRPTSPSPST